MAALRRKSTSRDTQPIDVGCSGGIEPAWRLFVERFRAVGFDISVDARLATRAEGKPWLVGCLRLFSLAITRGSPWPLAAQGGHKGAIV